MTWNKRIGFATKAAAVHFLLSIVVAGISGLLVFNLWYPFPYRELSGGRELFLIVIAVDIVCGPLLTMVLFNPAKPKAELGRDLGLVIVIQLGALGYGLWTVWQARPLFLVLEVDRFKVISAPDWRGSPITQWPSTLQPRWWAGPTTVAIRAPKDEQERKTIMFESIEGGRDYAERPEFYIPYDSTAATKALVRAKPLSAFLQKQPSQQEAARKLATEKGADMAQWFYLPVIARQDWVAVLDKQGQIQGFLKGDGF
ncbi:MAG: pilus assembly protein [Polaromonas sp.]|nr:MAG: pilus assembly protein [Polaromonas sp.]